MSRWQVPVVLAAVAVGTALFVGPLVELPALALVAKRLGRQTDLRYVDRCR